MSLLRRLAAWAAWAALGLAAAAPAAAETLRVVDYGVYLSGVAASQEKPDSATGLAYTADRVRLLRQTDAAPARIGESLGFRVRVPEMAAGETATLRMAVDHPPITNPSGRVFTRHEAASAFGAGGVAFYAYTFEFEWECQPGPWRFSAALEDAAPVTIATIMITENACRPRATS